ncbi:putative sulfur deprivation response regulator [Diplonema papillatum]|nr:putative sulfur deprivation response regulator [Diplonema papillatum]
MPEPIEVRVASRNEIRVSMEESSETSRVQPQETYFQRLLRGMLRYKLTVAWVSAVSIVCIVCSACRVGFDRTEALSWESWFSIWTTLMSLTSMVNGVAPESALVVSTLVLLLAGVVTRSEAWAGFASTSALAPGPLFVVAKGIEKAGTVQFVVKHLLGKPKSVREALFRLTLPVTAVSGFLNDTPVVMIMMPIAEKWSRETGIPLEKLFMPLSFAALLGGTCTMIGSSTNLVLQGLVEDEVNPPFDLGFFSMTPAAAPAALLSCLYLILAGPYLLPNRSGKAAEDKANSEGAAEAPLKQYAIQVLITAPLAGETLSNLGLTSTKGATLLHVLTGGCPDSVESVESAGQRQLEAGDVAVLLATVPAFLELRRRIEIAGGLLPPLAPQYALLGLGRRKRRLFEAVLADSNPLVGVPVNKADFLKTYNAALFTLVPENACSEPPLCNPLAITDGDIATTNTDESPVGNTVEASQDFSLNSNSEEQKAKSPPPLLSVLREQPLKGADRVLIEAYTDFFETHRTSADFLSVAPVPDSEPPRFEKRKDSVRKYIAGIILCAMVGSVASGALHIFDAAVGASILMVFTHCLTPADAFNAVRLRILLAIVFAFGVGSALKKTNVTKLIADGFISVAKELYFMGDFAGSVGVLLLIFLACASMSCIVSNQATVILLYPIVKEIVDLEGTSLKRFVITLLIGASCSFMTPFGYQTNLMVMKPGGYKFLDYTKYGAPLTLLMGVLTSIFTRLLI